MLTCCLHCCGIPLGNPTVQEVRPPGVLRLLRFQSLNTPFSVSSPRSHDDDDPLRAKHCRQVSSYLCDAESDTSLSTGTHHEKCINATEMGTCNVSVDTTGKQRQWAGRATAVRSHAEEAAISLTLSHFSAFNEAKCWGHSVTTTPTSTRNCPC